MSTDNIKWGGAVSLPDGHRLFYNTDPAHAPEQTAAIADDSGLFPHDTDDGTLWLDVTRCLRIISGEDGDREHIFIPVIDDNGAQTHIVSNAATILRLSKEFRWTIDDDTFFYNVR